MGLLKKYYLRGFIIVISCNIIKGQVNCKAFENENCKKACELANLAEIVQGQKYSQIAFDEAIKLCPNFDYAYREKSVPYLKRGDFVTWKYLIDKAVEINPKANLGYRGWCQFQFLRNYDSAIEDIENFEELVGEDNVGSSQNGDHNLEIVKALCYKGKGDKIKAIQIMERQLSKEKYSPMLFDYYHLGVLYYELQNYVKAKDCFDKQINNNDYYAEPYYFLSLIYLKLNNKIEAERMIDKALNYYSNDKYLKDFYNVFIDKVYEKEMKILKEKIVNKN